MRFPFLAALLGATLLTPAAAIAQDGRDQGRGGRAERQHARAERQQGGAERLQQRAEWQQQRAERQQGRAERQQERGDRPQFGNGRQPVGIVPPEARQERRDVRGDARQDGRGGAVTTREYRSDQIQPGSDIRGNGRNVRAYGRDGGRDDRRGWDRGDRPDRVDWNRRGVAGNDWNGDRANRNDNRGWRDDRDRNDGRGWNRGWRAESRYDWRANRYRNRAAYHLPRYYAPYGWRSGYQRFGIGVTLSSVLWGQNYWIGDPFSYRLPDAWGPYRWVRYYNDALLVDVRSGRVVDVEYDIFW